MLKEILSQRDRLSSKELATINDVLKPLTAQNRLALMLTVFDPQDTVFTFINSDLLPKLAGQTYRSVGIRNPADFLFVDTQLYESPTHNFVGKVSARGAQEGYVVRIVKSEI